MPGVRQLQRLGKNISGYFGETIEIGKVLTECGEAAQAHGWEAEEIRVSPNLALPAFIRKAVASPPTPSEKTPGPKVETAPPSPKQHRIYISTGIHGDEPAGPLAVRQLLRDDTWPSRLDLWLCACLNPTGFLLNRRENAAGLDLNRQYLQPTAEETRAHIDWLERQPSFDLCLSLHEDWESHGFYVYELNPDNRPSLAEAMVASVTKVCPVDYSELIEGRPAKNGIIRPGIDPLTRPQWPEAFYLLTHKTRQSYTLEAPSDYPLSARVAALVTAVETGLQEFVRGA